MGIDTRRMARGGYTLRKRAPELARETREKPLELPTEFALLGAYVNVVCVCVCVVNNTCMEEMWTLIYQVYIVHDLEITYI